MSSSSLDNSEMAERINDHEWSMPTDFKVMERLHHIGSLFVMNLDFQDIMAEIVEAALFITGTDMGNLQLYDPQTDCLKIIAHRGLEKPWLDFWENVKIEHGACGAAIKKGDRIIVEDVTQSDIFAGTPALDVQLAAGVRAVQSTPLVGRSGKPLGMLSTHFRKPHRPSAQTLRRIDTLARHATDIIERIKAEDDLKESEARFRALVDASSEVLYRMSPDWREMRQLHSRGFLSDTLRPSSTWLEEYIHPDDRPHFTAVIAKAIRTKSVFELEHRVRRMDGTLGWTFSRAVPLMDKKGDIVEWFGAASDVTERKQAEEVLGESEARFREMFDNMSSGVVVYEAIRDGEDFVFKDLNRSAERIEQIARHDLIGKSIVQMFPSVIEFGLFEVFQRVWRTGLPQHHPVSLYKDQRISGWRENYVYKLPSGEIVAIYDDVTDRKRAEESLRARRDELAEAQRIAKMGSWRFDIKTEAVDWSDELYRIFEIDKAEFDRVYTSFISRVHSDDKPLVLETNRKARLDGKPFDVEYRIEPPTGGVKYIHETGHGIKNSNGEVVTLLGIAQDITERKRAEEALKQANQTLEKRVAERTAMLQRLALDLTKAEDRERRQLAAILHDDFQQEVAYIKLELNRLARRPGETDIEQHLMRLAQFTDGCIGKMRHLSYALNPPVLQRSGLLAALDLLAKDMQEHQGLTVNLHTQPEAEPASSAVASMLYRSTRELLLNVAKHAGVNTADVDARLQGTSVRVEVTDQGKGFDYSAIHKGQGRESGFGLYNIEDRMKFLGGSIQFKTSPGKGCCVLLTVPLAKEPKSTAAVEKIKAADRNGTAAPEKARIVARSSDNKQVRVLLVEDHNLMRKGLAGLLRSHNEMVIVGEAMDGQKAIELADRLRPHVILMDVTMPKMDGIEATARIARNHPDIRIIGLSMHNDEDTRQKMLNAGASGFLVKTDSPEKLIKTILRVHCGDKPKKRSAGEKNSLGKKDG